MIKKLLDVLRGMVIGLANVIPGVSGGTMAVGMGVYDKILLAVTNIRKDFKGSLKILWPYALGVVLGVVVFARVLEYLFEHFPLPTAFAFIGLILGALPSIFREIKGKVPVAGVLAFLVLAALVVGLPLMKEPGTLRTLELSWGNAFLAVFLGALAAFTMVVPGVSGSMVMLLLGYYNAVLGLVNDGVRALTAMDIPGLLAAAGIGLPFLIGCLLGIIFAAKGIGYLLRHWPKATFWGILGLVIASPFPILYAQDWSGAIGVGTVIACAAATVAGFVISMLMSKKQDA